MIHIQPTSDRGASWDALARREELYYEPLELSLPPYPGQGAAADERIGWYKTGGRVRSFHGAFIGIDPAAGDETIREISRQRCRESCGLARLLGAERVIFHSSCVPFLRGGYLENWADVCAAFYAELAEGFGLTVCVENSQDTDPAPLEALLRRTAGAAVNICLDIGHANYSRASLEEWFDRLAGRIGCLHLSDNRGLFDDHLPLGQGSVDWALAHRLWQEQGGTAPVTLEVGGISGVETSLGYLDEHGFFGRGK